MTHLCVGNPSIIGSDNGLSPGWSQAIIRTNAGILLFGPLGTNFSDISIQIQTFLLKKMHFKMSSAKWRPFCLGFNVFNTKIIIPSEQQTQYLGYMVSTCGHVYSSIVTFRIYWPCGRTPITKLMGPTWGSSGPTGLRWAPCWPHELCYLSKPWWEGSIKTRERWACGCPCVIMTSWCGLVFHITAPLWGASNITY